MLHGSYLRQLAFQLYLWPYRNKATMEILQKKINNCKYYIQRATRHQTRHFRDNVVDIKTEK